MHSCSEMRSARLLVSDWDHAMAPRSAMARRRATGIAPLTFSLAAYSRWTCLRSGTSHIRFRIPPNDAPAIPQLWRVGNASSAVWYDRAVGAAEHVDRL